jgi:hypothetical protein
MEELQEIHKLEAFVDPKNIDVFNKFLEELGRLQEIERKAIEQSEEIQRNWYTPMEVSGMKHEIDRLNAELAQIKEDNRWIPVSERLPTVDKMVLVRTALNEILTRKLFDASLLEWCDENTDYFLRNVTHWRPLPSAPTGGGE